MMSLERGLSVIRAFSRQHQRLTIADVARITGLSRAAARRCLHTLQLLGYVGSDGRLYALRPKVLSLGYAFISSMPLATTVQPFLERVSERLGESASLGVLEEDEIVYVARAATKRIMSVSLNIGSRLPAHCTSMGRVLLAHLPAGELDGYLARVPLAPLTEKTITRRDELERALDQVRQRGYALVDQELEMGLRSISVPVHDTRGGVVGAMNVSTQAGRVARRDMENGFLPVLQEAARDVRAALVA
ncbi:MAG: helix-turn-helix domain-containing protein [Alphaproteobacteria bacterium]|nr:helix-turn-helix domain-containing protein [Alphaproteobacteria bacterium]